MMINGKRVYLVAGLVITATFWYINWTGIGLRTHWAFFPLWLGYITTIDALSIIRGRRSLILHEPLVALGLFVLSAPLWWLFEWMNDRAGYWEYLPENVFGPLEHAFWSTICFSTVVPAIIVTVNLLLSFKIFHRHHVSFKAASTEAGRRVFFITGWIMLIVMLIWPDYGMAFMWVSLFFILSPVNAWMRKPSLMHETARGDWRMVFVLFVAALICGFFWELWNWFGWPRWVYTFPYLNGMKIFEMPLAGYLGYLPFGLEVWAVTALVFPRLGRELLSGFEEKSN